MKAFILSSYGSPDRFELTETGVPAPADGEVLVRVRATSVNPYDWHHMRGEPYDRTVNAFICRSKVSVLQRKSYGVR